MASFCRGWMALDYLCDIVYLMDIFVRMHEGKQMPKCLFIYTVGTFFEKKLFPANEYDFFPLN